MSLWDWGCHGQQLAQLSVILSLFCAASLPTNGTDTSTWESTSEIALQERIWASSDGISPMLLIGVIFVKQQEQRTIQCLFSGRAYVSLALLMLESSQLDEKKSLYHMKIFRSLKAAFSCVGCCIPLSTILAAVASWQFEMGWAFSWISFKGKTEGRYPNSSGVGLWKDAFSHHLCFGCSLWREMAVSLFLLCSWLWLFRASDVSAEER